MQGFWLNGKWYPIIAGGSGEGEGGEGEGGEESGISNQEGEESKGSSENGAGPGEEKSSFTQEQVNSIVNKQLRAAQKKWQKEQDEKAAKAKMSETEKLEAEKKEAEEKAQAIQKAAGQRIIKAEAKIKAAAAGVKSERVGAFVKLLDLSDIDVGDDGEPDADALKAEVEKVLGDFPEFKGDGRGGGSSGGDFGNKGTQHIFTRQEIKEMAKKQPEEFRKNEAEIDRQMQAGLIK